MIAPEDVLRVVWSDGTETFTMLREVGSHAVLSTVARDPITHDLHCHTCHRDGREPCECIRAAMAFVHKRKGA